MNTPVAVRDAVVAVGRQLGDEAPTLVTDLTSLLVSRIPELSKDSRLIEMLQASIGANLTTVCQILANRMDAEATNPPTAAIEYAIRHAQNNLPGSSLIRAYQVGQRLLLERAMELVSRQGLDGADQVAAIQFINEQVHTYTDRVVAVSVDTHENERRQQFTARARASRAIVQRVLRGDPVDADDFRAETDYGFEGIHRSFTVWQQEAVSADERAPSLEAVARRVAAVISPREIPLLVSVDATTMWGWVHLPDDKEAVDRAGLSRAVSGRQMIRVAFGGALRGREGFLRSHQQAQAAHLVATDAPSYRDQAVVTIDDPSVGLAALLVRDRRALENWMHDTLGALAANTASARATRETLAAYVANGESYARTAEALGVHRNTVTGRIERFFAARAGHPVDLVELAVAIRMFDLLGLQG